MLAAAGDQSHFPAGAAVPRLNAGAFGAAGARWRCATRPEGDHDGEWGHGRCAGNLHQRCQQLELAVGSEPG